MPKKPGWQTSEFWVALISIILPMILRAAGVDIPTEQVLGGNGVAGAYVLGRGITKRTPAVPTSTTPTP